ncbi:putative serine-threonine protein kinase, plant-type [Corchorus olitorius]|uniref:Serine-threonine protein kinase, plant-type n=1 Tax=Corchorus olitorius TaxID=93759 RepID=A0A1R3FXA3_9ROSI|nr:putative serine-threonine protein kinase, plant-type [Corchorus olitorius]
MDRLPNLTSFRVFRNKLTGFLAPEFGLHSRLGEFDVSENQFSGQLPENLCVAGVLDDFPKDTPCWKKKERERYLPTWKADLVPHIGFHRRKHFVQLNKNNLIGSGGLGKVYRITINRSGESVSMKKIWNARKLDYKLEKELLAK